MVKLEDVKALKVPELREELKVLGLDTKGVKADLVKRLEEALSAEASTVAAPQVTATSTSTPAAKDTVTAPEGQTGASRVPIHFKRTQPEAKATAATGAAPPAAEKAAIPKPTEGLTEAEKLKQRAERFGVELPLANKLKVRAERFDLKPGSEANGAANKKAGIAPLTEAQKSADAEKRKERAKRFNLPVPTTAAEVAAKKKARMERFGVAAGSKVSSSELEEKKTARAERFALDKKPAETSPSAPLSEAEAKRKARAIRFAAS